MARKIVCIFILQATMLLVLSQAAEVFAAVQKIRFKVPGIT